MILRPSPGSDFAKIAQPCRMAHEGIGDFPNKPGKQNDRFPISGKRSFFAVVHTNAQLAGIWDRSDLSRCPDRCPACRDLIRTRNHATGYPDAQLAGNGKRAGVRTDALLARIGKPLLCQPCENKSFARLITMQSGFAFRMILPGLLFCKTA